MARTIYKYQPINRTPDKGIGILLPFNKNATGRSTQVTSYKTNTSGKGVFELSYSTEEQSVSNLRNLLLTTKGERFMQPNFGTRINEYLFRQSVPQVATELSNSLTEDINYWLPYVILNSVDVVVNEHRIDIRIRFRTSQTGANLVINILAQENTIITSEAILDTAIDSGALVETYGGF